MAKKHEDIARQLREVTGELRRLNLPEERKLSAKAFSTEACRIARKEPVEIERIKAQLVADSGQTWPNAWAAVLRLAREVRTEHWPAPASDARRLSFAIREDALAEGFSVFDLQAVAVSLAVESHPTAFGKCIDREAYEKTYRAVEARERELKAAYRDERLKLQAEAAALEAEAAVMGVD